MSERKQVVNAIIKVWIAFIFALLYCLAGSEEFGGLKWLRRFVAPTILCGGIFYFSKDWRALVSLPVMFLSLSLGYGSDIELWKVIKRGIYGLANGISSSGKNILNKKWLLAGFQVALLISAYICFGVWNPFPDARVEEFFLGFLIAFIPIMSA